MTNVKETIRKIDITFLRELVNTRDNSSIRNDSTFIQKKEIRRSRKMKNSSIGRRLK